MYNNIPNRLELWRKLLEVDYRASAFMYIIAELNRFDVIEVDKKVTIRNIKSNIKELEILEQVYS